LAARLPRRSDSSWCKDCRYRAEPDAAGQAERYGADMAVPKWAAAARVLALRQPQHRFRRHLGTALKPA
jgi:hypothetical protein